MLPDYGLSSMICLHDVRGAYDSVKIVHTFRKFFCFQENFIKIHKNPVVANSLVHFYSRVIHPLVICALLSNICKIYLCVSASLVDSVIPHDCGETIPWLKEPCGRPS